MADPQLTKAVVSFHTNENAPEPTNPKPDSFDKDHDTNVTVLVKDSAGTIAARLSGALGYFAEDSDNGPFALEVQNPSTKQQLQTGNVEIRIDPNGHDTWGFNFELDLGFVDGSHLSAEADGLQLTQDSQEAAFGIA